MAEVAVPTFDALMNPVLQALKSLGGSGTIEEINTKVSEIAGLSDEQLEVLHRLVFEYMTSVLLFANNCLLR